MLSSKRLSLALTSPSELQNTDPHCPLTSFDLSTCLAQRRLRHCPPNSWTNLVFFHLLLYRTVSTAIQWPSLIPGSVLWQAFLSHTSCFIHPGVLPTSPPKSQNSPLLSTSSTASLIHTRASAAWITPTARPLHMHSPHPVSLPLPIHSADKSILSRCFILLPLLETLQWLSTTFSTKTNIPFRSLQSWAQSDPALPFPATLTSCLFIITTGSLAEQGFVNLVPSYVGLASFLFFPCLMPIHPHRFTREAFDLADTISLLNPVIML